jgi:hypothetical protein
MNQDIESSRCRLNRLLVGCPQELIANPNPSECPLHNMRAKPLRERLVWARTVAPSIVTRVLDYHDWCRAKKEVLALTEHCLVKP